jgi:hypothetical protein
MDKRLLEAASSSDATLMKHLALDDPDVLLGTTQRGNTCLHISSMFGHLSFCTDVVALNLCQHRWGDGTAHGYGEQPCHSGVVPLQALP